MFPTGGFLRGVLCPENDAGESGRCKRPYCHFHHVRRVQSVESAVDVKKCGEQRPSTKPVIESSSLPSYRKHKDRTVAAKPITYVPTPLSLCKKPPPPPEVPQGELDTVFEPDAFSVQSAYTPTPLSELETRHEVGNEDFDDSGVQGATASDTSSHEDVQSSTRFVEQDDEQHVTISSSVHNAQVTEDTMRAQESGFPEASSAVDGDKEIEDVIIETHSYGGITVTTRTPRSLCRSVTDADDGDTEYNPFDSDLAHEQSDHRNEGDAIQESVNYEPGHDSGFSQPSSFSEETDIGSGCFGEYNPTGQEFHDCSETMSEGSKYDALVGHQPLYEGENTGFKGYSHPASYSYSDSGSQVVDLAYNMHDNCTTVGDGLESDGEGNTSSSPDCAISSKCVPDQKIGSSAIHKCGDSTSISKKNIAGKSIKSKVSELKKKARVDENFKKKEIEQKSKMSISKTLSQETKREDKKSAPTLKKGTKTTDLHSHAQLHVGKSSTTLPAGNEGKKANAAPTSDKKKLRESEKGKVSIATKKVVRHQMKGKQNDGNANQQSEKNTADRVKNAPKLVPDSTEEERPNEGLKRKVSSEQLSDFFKKRQELKANKRPVKTKVSQSDTKKPDRKCLDTKQETQLQESIPKHSKRKNENVDNKKVKENAEKVTITASKDRSLFESVKMSSKVVDKRPSVKECGIDLFAIANDTSSENDDDDDDFNSETARAKSSKIKQTRPVKVSSQSGKSKQAERHDGSRGSSKSKRPASPSRHSDPKRVKKTSTVQARRESAKLVELDLFGDDSDGESDEVILLDAESPQKCIVPPSVSRSKHREHTSMSVTNLPLNSPSVTCSSQRQKKKSNFQSRKDTHNTPAVSSLGNKKHALSSSQVKDTSSKRPASSGKASNFLSTKTTSPNKSTSRVGKLKAVMSGAKGTDEFNIEHSSNLRKMSAPEAGCQKTSEKRRASEIASSDDDDYDDLPNGLQSVSEEPRPQGRGSYHGNEVGADLDRGGPESSDYEDMKRFLEESSSDEDTFDECFRIFQEEHGEGTLSTSHRQRRPEREMEDPETVSAHTGKQRVAHSSKSGNARLKSAAKKPRNLVPSASQMLHNRYLQLQQRMERASPQEEGGAAETHGSRAASSSSTGRQRIAHQGTSNSTLSRLTLGPSPSNSTIAMTNAKLGKRMAHTPRTVTKRPVIPADYSSKVPMNIRQRYLNVFIDELLKTAATEQEAFDKALAEEKTVHQRASSKNIYLNLCVNALKKLQNATAAILKSPPTTPTLTSPKKVISHAAVLGGKPATKTTYSIYKPLHAADIEKFDGVFLYEKLKPFLLTEEQLRDNGFPRPTDIPGQAAIFKKDDNKTVTSSDPNLQVCSRCGTTFLREPDGEYITRDSCTYHWGRPWTRRIAGMVESRFSCCSGDMEAKGCCVARLHVTDNKSSNLGGFMKTMSKPLGKATHPGMYSMDCEMCYTTLGLELTRVTVIDDSLAEVYDTLVKPDNEVIDYNTRFSGITEEDLGRVETKLRDVQAVLLNMFSSDTILMGHSLESDLLALKMLHSTVIDTSVVFPHRRGPPYKRALKTLMAEFLKRLIQDDIGGHDSTEDARSCMELMIWKVKEVAKVKRKR